MVYFMSYSALVERNKSQVNKTNWYQTLFFFLQKTYNPFSPRALCIFPVSTRRCFDVDTMLFGRQKRCYNVETTSCAYWVVLLNMSKI